MGALLSALQRGDRPVLAANDLAGAQTGDQRIGLLDHLCDILEIESARHPLLIIVDDLQWADHVTLLAVASLPLRLVPMAVTWILGPPDRPGVNSARTSVASPF